MRYVTYSEKEKNIVEKGLIEIQKILMGTDDEAKASLLFCLDKYLDPYYDMYTMWKCVELVLKECIRIFTENKKSNDEEFNMGEFPQSAIVVYNTKGTEDGNGYDNLDTIEEVWEIKGLSFINIKDNIQKEKRK